MSGDRRGARRRVRVAVGTLIIFAVLWAFLAQAGRCQEVSAWLVALVTVLGIGAGTAVFGAETIRDACALLRGERVD